MQYRFLSTYCSASVPNPKSFKSQSVCLLYKLCRGLCYFNKFPARITINSAKIPAFFTHVSRPVPAREGISDQPILREYDVPDSDFGPDRGHF